MGRIIKDLVQRFRDENIVGKYIYANVAVYLVFALLGVVVTLFNAVGVAEGLVSIFRLPSDITRMLMQPWSIVTYMFLHAGFMHLLWNMLALYLFGRIFITFYSTRHFIGAYILGGIMGGLFFVIAYNIFPFFESQVENSYLVGASAAVLAVVVASAVRSPNYTVNLVLFGAVRLSTLAIATVVISLLLVSSDNAGGNFAHLGGALAGWLFAVMLNKGRDVTTPINAVSGFMLGLWNRLRAWIKERRPGSRIVKPRQPKSEREADYEYNARKKESNDEIDRILEKLSQGGYSALTDEEKRRLYDASHK